jgi:hypothetical protein
MMPNRNQCRRVGPMDHVQVGQFHRVECHGVRYYFPGVGVLEDPSKVGHTKNKCHPFL